MNDQTSWWALAAAVLGAVGTWLFNRLRSGSDSNGGSTPPAEPTPGSPTTITLTGPLAELLLPLVRLLQDPTFGPALKPFVDGFISWVRERIFPIRDGSVLPFQGNPWAPAGGEPAGPAESGPSSPSSPSSS